MLFPISMGGVSLYIFTKRHMFIKRYKETHKTRLNKNMRGQIHTEIACMPEIHKLLLCLKCPF